MALISKSFSLDMTPGVMPPLVNVSEYDVNRQFTIFLQDNGGPFTPASGTTAKIEGTLSNGFPFSVDATVNSNAVTFTLEESMTAAAGRAWVKVKLTNDGAPVSSCGFIMDVDRAGVEADTVIGAPGFEEQIVDAVQDWLEEHPPAVGGMTEDVKTALLNCFENVAWINDDGQDYYDALYAALYPPVDVLSISAVFDQGSAVIYDTDSLDDLKQYLVVTATMTDSTTQTLEDTDYTLSGTLAEGTSTITVSYGGKTTTFNVTVTGEPWDYKWDYSMGKLEDQDGWVLDSGSSGSSTLTGNAERFTCPAGSKYRQAYISNTGSLSTLRTMSNGLGVMEVTFSAHLDASSGTSTGARITVAQSSNNRIGVIVNSGKFLIYSNNIPANGVVIGNFQNDTEYTVKIVYKGTTADVYINDGLVGEDIGTTITVAGSSNSIMVNNLGSDSYYVDWKSLKLRVGSIS